MRRYFFEEESPVEKKTRSVVRVALFAIASRWFSSMDRFSRLGLLCGSPPISESWPWRLGGA